MTKIITPGNFFQSSSACPRHMAHLFISNEPILVFEDETYSILTVESETNVVFERETLELRVIRLRQRVSLAIAFN